MKKSYSLIVVVPLHPDVSLERAERTIADFIRCVRVSYRIIVMDDSQGDVAAELGKRFPELDVHYASRPLGKRCGSYINLSMVYKRVLERYHFNALFKLETDVGQDWGAGAGDSGKGIGEPGKAIADSGAVVARTVDRVLRLFDEDPTLGIAGRPSPFCRRDPGEVGWTFIRKPLASWTFARLYRQARTSGYREGGSVSWGDYFISGLLLAKLNEAGLLPDYRLGCLNLGDGHLFGLLSRVAGFDLVNLQEKKHLEAINESVHG
jgi:hypothetical protein